MAGLGILAQGAALRSSGEKLLRHRWSQLVGREVVRNRHTAAVLLDVGAVPADADDEPVAEVDRIDLTRVDLVQIGDEALQALVAVVAEIERPQPADTLLVPRGDPIEDVFHPGGELVVDEPVEVALEQLHDGERDVRRDEGRALLEDVAAVDDRADDRGVGRGPADAALLERAHERRLRVPRRRGRLVPDRFETSVLELLPFLERRQAPVGLFVGRLVVIALLVGREEAPERDHGPGRGELGIRAVGRSGSQPHRDGLPGRVRHLRGERPSPDELVERQPVPVELPLDLLRRAEAVARGTDRLVGFLRVLHLPVVATGVGGNRVRAEERTRLVTRGLEGRL